MDPVKATFDRTMGFDKPDMCVHRQIFGHEHVGVEPQRRQMKTIGLGYRMFDQAPA
jgi:hypothetical protein